MSDQSELWWIDSATEPVHGAQIGAAVLRNVHAPEACAGRACVLHSPSEHHMRSWPLNWRGDKGAMERLCPHGVGHPDPDDLGYHHSQGRDWMGVHGCDGCCLSPAGPTAPSGASVHDEG